MATPQRGVCDNHARTLEGIGRLRFIALGTRRGTAGIPPDHTRLKPAIGLATYICARLLSVYPAESCRFALLPWFDRWVLSQLSPGDHMISSYGYANDCFRWVRQQGGCTFVDAGNSHIDNFWEIMVEEHRRWKCPLPPVSPFWRRRSQEMLEHVDYVLSPSTWVTNSFLERGFREEQIIPLAYPVDLSCFSPDREPRPRNRPLTVICTGQISLRKGTPYLLEAFRIILKSEPKARLLLTADIATAMRPILGKYSDLPIDWAPALPHPALAARLRSADVFVLPSLEEGLARTACEALACGLPAVLTTHTGANDLIRPGIDGEIVPIRDAAAIAEGVLRCWERIKQGTVIVPSGLHDRLSYSRFRDTFLGELKAKGFLDSSQPEMPQDPA